MFKKALIAFSLCVGLSGAAYAELPAFNQKFYSNGTPLAEKPPVLRDFIEFRTARGFSEEAFLNLKGESVKLSQWRNKLIVVDVWATWCEPCLRSLPAIWDLQKHYNRDDSKVRIVSIALDKNMKRVQKFLKRNNFEGFDTLADTEQKLGDAVPLDVIPSVFVLDGNGKLVGFVRGNVDWKDASVKTYFDRLAEKYAVRKEK